MKSYKNSFVAVFAVAVVILVGVSPVSAGNSYQTTATVSPVPTITPTISIPALFPTTDPNTGFSSCPPGLPAGYGVVTPSGLWNTVCSQCLPTPTPFGDDYSFPATPSAVEVCTTPVPLGDETCVNTYPTVAVATGTPFGTPPPINLTPTASYATPTALPSAIFECQDIEEMTCSIDLNGSRMTYDVGIVQANNEIYLQHIDFGLLQNNYPIYLTYDLNYKRQDSTQPASTWNSIQKLFVWYGTIDGVGGSEVFNTTENGNSYYSPITTRHFDTNVPLVLSGGEFGFYMGSGWSESTSIFGAITFTADPWFEVATPAPVGSYCDTIQGEGDVDFDLGSIFGQISDPVCITPPTIDTTNIVEVLLDWFPSIGDVFPSLATAYTFTPKTICFIGYGFIPINFFGVTVDFVYFVVLIVGWFVIRNSMHK